MITRRSFLYGAAWAAALPFAVLAPDGGGGEEPPRYTELPDEPLPGNYPYDKPIPSLRSEIVAPLPSRVVAGYWTARDSPLRLAEIPEHYNTVFLFHATPVGGAPGTTGAVQWNNPSNARGAATHFRADLAELRRTRTAILTVGGAEANVDLSTRTRAVAFLDSVQRIYGDLGGFDGLDWNNYEGEQQPNTDQMIWISQQLKALYGQNFAITSPPAPWRPADVAHCRAMIDAGVMDMVSPQYYDGPGLAGEGYIVNSINEWVARMGNAGRVGVGFGLSNADNYSTRDAIEGAWRTLAARHPTLRGAYNWNITTDERMGWPFANTVGPVVMASAPVPTTIPPTTIPPFIPLPAPMNDRTRTTLGAPGNSRMPDSVRGTYWLPGTGQPLDTVPPSCNLVWIGLSHAQGSGSAAGIRTDAAMKRAAAKAGMDALRRRTAPPKIILSSFSGLQNPPDLASPAGADEFAAGIIRISKEYGFDGFDWDLEHAPDVPASSLERTVRAVVTEMRTINPAYAFTVTAPLAPGRESRPTDSEDIAEFVRRCRDVIDVVQQRHFNRDNKGLDVTDLRARVQAWLHCGLRQDQVGFLWVTQAESGASGSESAAVAYANQLWDITRRTWPNLPRLGTGSITLQ